MDEIIIRYEFTDHLGGGDRGEGSIAIFGSILGSLRDDQYEEDLKDNTRQNIGRITCHIFDLDNNYDIMEMLDEHADFNPLYDLLGNQGHFCQEIDQALESNYSHKILLLDRVKIEKEFRQQGIGKLAINNAIKHFGGDFSVIALICSPMQFLEEDSNFAEIEYSDFPMDSEAAQESLENYYRSLGFKKLKGNESGHLMYRVDLG